MTITQTPIPPAWVEPLLEWRRSLVAAGRSLQTVRLRTGWLRRFARAVDVDPWTVDDEDFDVVLDIRQRFQNLMENLRRPHLRLDERSDILRELPDGHGQSIVLAVSAHVSQCLDAGLRALQLLHVRRHGVVRLRVVHPSALSVDRAHLCSDPTEVEGVVVSRYAAQHLVDGADR